MIASTRVFYLADSEVAAVTSVVPELHHGINELTLEESVRFARQLSTEDPAAGKCILRKRRQAARTLWEIWHGPYDEPPEWLK